MSTKSHFIHAAAIYATQAGPLTVECIFSDTTNPSHGLLVYDSQTTTLNYHEFNEIYTQSTAHACTPSAWGSHPLPTKIDVLSIDDNIRSQLKSALGVSDEYIENLDDPVYRYRLLSLLNDFVAAAERKFKEKGTALLWNECHDLWTTQETHAFKNTKFSITHSEEELRKQLDFATARVQNLEANALSRQDAATFTKMLEELRSTNAALTARLQNVENLCLSATTAPIPQTLAPPLQPTPLAAPAFPPLQGELSIDCRTWPALLSTCSNYENVKAQLFRAARIYECNIRTEAYMGAHHAFNNAFDAIMPTIDVTRPDNARFAITMNCEWKQLMMEANKANGLRPANARAQRHEFSTPDGLRMLQELESELGTHFVPANNGKGSFVRGRGYARKEKNGGGAAAAPNK